MECRFECSFYPCEIYWMTKPYVVKKLTQAVGEMESMALQLHVRYIPMTAATSRNCLQYMLTEHLRVLMQHGVLVEFATQLQIITFRWTQQTVVTTVVVANTSG